MQWILNNLGTIVPCIVLAGVVALVVLRLVKNKKRGRSSCGCGCADCPMGGSCQSRK